MSRPGTTSVDCGGLRCPLRCPSHGTIRLLLIDAPVPSTQPCVPSCCNSSRPRRGNRLRMVIGVEIGGLKPVLAAFATGVRLRARSPSAAAPRARRRVPVRVAVRQQLRGEPVREHRDADRRHHGEQQGALVREGCLVDEDDGEDDRREARGPNQPTAASVGRRAPVPSRDTATGSIRTAVRLSTA